MQNKAVPIVIAVILVVVLGGGAYSFVHHMRTTTIPPTSSTTTQATTSSEVIQTKTTLSVGSYLADATGNTLYIYGADTTGVSNCSGSCLYNWPIYNASNAPATLPANVTVITRSDGSKQYAYKGMPLYNFSGDSAGQVSGDNISNFHVAKP